MYTCFVGSSSLSLIFALYLTLNVVFFFLIHSVFSFAILCFFSVLFFWGSLCFVRLWCVCEFHIFPSISLFALLLPSFVCNHLTLLRLPMFFFFSFFVCVSLPLPLLLLLTVNRTSKYKDGPHYTIQYYTVYKNAVNIYSFLYSNVSKKARRY